MSVLQVRNNADTDFDSLGFLDPHTSTNKNYPQHRTNDYSDTDTTCTDTSSETGSSPLEEDDDDDDGADQHDNDDNCDQEKREHETDKLVKKHENDTEFYCDIDMLDDQVCTVVSTLSSTLSSIPALSTALLGKTSQTKSNGTMVPPTIVTFQSLFATTTTTTTTTVSRATILNASLGSFTPFQVLNLSNQKLNAHYLSTRSLSIFRQVLVKNLLALLYEVNPTLDDQWWDSTSGYAAVSGQGYGSVDGHDNNSNTMVDPTSSGDMNNPFVSDKTLRSYNGFDGFDDDDDEDEDDYYYRKRSRDPGAGSLRPWSSSEDKTTQDDVNQLVLQAAAALTRASSSKKQMDGWMIVAGNWALGDIYSHPN
ncbi:hypothetical protein EDD11_005763 [Mortierella claussenii]|nr:hypothetical protein EDD11_005763 [Mortierella claussenii]